MQITEIHPNETYQLTGADFLAAISNAVKSTIEELGISRKSEDKWAGKQKFTTEEAAEYLGIKTQTLYIFNAKYNINRIKARPSYYLREELDRVEQERKLRPE